MEDHCISIHLIPVSTPSYSSFLFLLQPSFSAFYYLLSLLLLKVFIIDDFIILYFPIQLLPRIFLALSIYSQIETLKTCIQAYSNCSLTRCIMSIYCGNFVTLQPHDIMEKFSNDIKFLYNHSKVLLSCIKQQHMIQFYV